ncbi:MAG TPA: FixH family protein [Nitrospirota bacterium]|nr:FixH family protein [Nitrospirota bacterium]
MRTLIIVIGILVVAATAATIFIGTRNFEGLVVDRPYETGIDWDRIQERKAKLGWSATLSRTSYPLGRNDLIVNIAGRNCSPMSDTILSITVSRPSTNRYDRTYQALRQIDGSYLASIELPLPGRWDVIIHVTSGQEQADFKTSLAAERSGP